MGSLCWEVRRRGSLERSVGEDDMGPQIEDPRLPPLQIYLPEDGHPSQY